MKFISRMILSLFLLLVGSAYADGMPSWNEEALSAWVGKYPTTTTNGKTVSILDQAEVRKILYKILPASERKALGFYDVEAPIRQVEGFLVVNKCLPHYCPAELAVIVIDLKNPRLWAGFFLRQEGRTSTRWYSNADDYSVLPEEIRRDFLARHGD